MEEFNCLDIYFQEEDPHASVISFQDDYPNPTFSYHDTVRQRTTIFGANKQEEICRAQAGNTAYDFSRTRKARGSDEDLFCEDLDAGSHEELPQPYFPSASANYQNREIQQKDSTQSHSNDPPSPQPQKKKKSKYIRKRSQPPKKKNQYKTKNLLSFLWTKTVNYLQKKCKMAAFDWWQPLKEKTGSMNEFNELFRVKDKGVQDTMEEMFNERYFFKMVMLSSINAEKKKTYITYIPILYRCYQKKSMHWIN